MKLVTLLLGSLLATGAAAGSAAADDVLRPPGGPVVVEGPPPPAAHAGGRAHGAAHAQRRASFRRALVERFDADGDGRLGPRERVRAIRALRRLERRLATSGPGLRERDRDRGELRERRLELRERRLERMPRLERAPLPPRDDSDQ